MDRRARAEGDVMLSCYIAGSSREVDRARSARSRLRACGVEILGDEWIEHCEQHGSLAADQPLETRATYASWDLMRVTQADVMLVLWPASPSVGTYIELGYALRAGAEEWPRAIVIAGGDSVWHAYVALAGRDRLAPPGHVAASDEDAIAWIVERAGVAMDSMHHRERALILVRRLDSGYWHVRGRGVNNWSQPPCWPASHDELRAHAHPEASEIFLARAAARARMDATAEERESGYIDRLARGEQR